MLRLAGVLLSCAASAQVSFRDDFEVPVVVQAGNNWEQLFRDHLADTVSVSPLAAHTGDAGLHIVNALSSNAGAGSIGLMRFFSGTGAQHLRAWFRASAVTAATGYDSVAFISRSSSFFTACQLYFHAAARGWRVAAFSETNQTTLRDSDGGVVPLGQWLLVELVATGMGTANGRCRAWVDGVLIADVTGIDWSTVQFRDLSLGPVNTELGNETVYDYDGFGAAAQAMASRLQVSLPVPMAVGQCTRFTVGLRSSEGGGVMATEDVPVALATSGPLTLASDPQCAVPVAGAVIPAGVDSVALYCLASQATDAGAVRATHPDLLDGVKGVSALETPDAGVPDAGARDGGEADAGGADAGASPPQRELAAGCGCGASPFGLLAAAALLGALRGLTARSGRRRRR